MFKNVEEPLLNSDWMYTFSHLLVYNVVVVVGDEEMHLVTMQSKCEKVPCFWCCSVCTGDRPFNLLFYHSSQTSLFSIEAGSSSEKAERCRSAPLCTIVAASPFYVKQFTLQMYSGRWSKAHNKAFVFVMLYVASVGMFKSLYISSLLFSTHCIGKIITDVSTMKQMCNK